MNLEPKQEKKITLKIQLFTISVGSIIGYLIKSTIDYLIFSFFASIIQKLFTKTKKEQNGKNSQTD